MTAADVKAGTLSKIIRENISEKVDVLVTDDFASYQAALQGPHWQKRHKTINHSTGKYVDGDIYTNTVESAFSLFKRGIVGTWHKISLKHLQAYLDEMCWRFNNRDNSFLFRDTLIRLIRADNLEYKELTAKACSSPKFKVQLEGGPEESFPTRDGLSPWAQMLSRSQLLLING